MTFFVFGGMMKSKPLKSWYETTKTKRHGKQWYMNGGQSMLGMGQSNCIVSRGSQSMIVKRHVAQCPK
jgi:hypothetical protein